MSKRFWFIMLAAVIALSFVAVGCRPKVEKTESEMPEGMTVTDSMNMNQPATMTEPAQNVAVETIPPTAAPEIKPAAVSASAPQDQLARNKDIQTALKAAGLYTGSIDGKIGPKTKAAIMAFQKSKGLKVDGKVGPQTWAEMQKYLIQQ